jgi:hypothetical protein
MRSASTPYPSFSAFATVRTHVSCHENAFLNQEGFACTRAGCRLKSQQQIGFCKEPVMTRIAFALAAAFFAQSSLNIVAADEADPALAAPPPAIKNHEVNIQLTPKIVGRVQQIRGTTNVAGIPVVLVKSDQDNEPWWVQGAPIQAKSQFAAKAQFGNARSIPGTRFRVCVIIVEPTAEYRTGQVVKTLPDVPKSDELIVTLIGGGRYFVGKDSGKDKKRSIEFTSPSLNSEVGQTVQLKGKVTKSVSPVVLIRPLQEGSLWWIQNEVKVTRSGTFSLKVVCGNKSTAEGTRFRIIALAVPNAERLSEFKIGESLKRLPKDIDTSRELLVTLRRDSRTATKTTSQVAK